jgi:heme exporter protein B
VTKYCAWVREALAMFTKDLRSELRTKYALNAIIMFAVVTLAAVSFAVGQFAIGNDVRAAFLWIVLFFSAMSGLGRVFIKEEDANTVHALRLAASPSVVYVGKLAFNTGLLFLLAVIVVPLFTVLMGLQVVNLGLFVGVVLLGTAGLAGAATIIAAIIAKASAKGELFAVLAFPILLPLLITAIGGTRVALDGGGGSGEIQFLLSYLVVMVTVSLMLFDFVWND